MTLHTVSEAVCLIYWGSMFVFQALIWGECQSWCCGSVVWFQCQTAATPAAGLASEVKVLPCVCVSAHVCATQSPWMRPHFNHHHTPLTSTWQSIEEGSSALQLVTPVAHTVSKRPRLHSPSSCSPPRPSGYAAMGVWWWDNTPSSTPPLLSPFFKFLPPSSTVPSWILCPLLQAP